MSGTINRSKEPTSEDARRRLQEIMDSSTTDGSGLYLQQVAQAGLFALKALPSSPEAQPLAATIARQIDDVYNSLQNITHINEELENDLLALLGAIMQIYEIADGTVVEKSAAFEENLQVLTAHIMWHTVANDDPAPAIATEEAAASGGPSTLASQTTNGDNSSISNLLNSPLGTSTPNDNAKDASSQSVTVGAFKASLLPPPGGPSETPAADVTPTDHLPGSSAMPADSDPRNGHHGRTLRAEETHQLGLNLLIIFRREGDLRDLSSSISLFRESLVLCPSESHLRLMATGSLADALWTRYKQMGTYSDLVEGITHFCAVLNLCPSGHPYRSATLLNLSTALMARYELENSLWDLSGAVKLGREALELHPPGHLDHASSLNNLSNALMTRYERGGDLIDLSEATERYREALKIRPPGHPDRASSLSNLSNALLAWYRREGNLRDLSEAAEHCQEALEQCPPGDPKRASYLNNLSDALLTRYRRKGNMLDLSNATIYCREALVLRPPGHSDRASSLNNLSNALMARYEREGSLLDLSTALEHYREALKIRCPGHPDRAASLNNLSNALMARYRRIGNLQDLSEATEQYREALGLRPPGHPGRTLSLSNLSIALVARYTHEGRMRDLSEAAEHYLEALEQCPSGDPKRATLLNNLSNALLTRYEREGSMLDLSNAVIHCREALELRPLGHADRASTLNSLSNALMARYERKGSLLDLSTAMEHCREALEIRSPGHPDRATSHNNLSNALMARYRREGSLLDLSEATEQRRQALELCPPGHINRGSCLSNLSNALMARYEHEGFLLDLSVAVEHYQEALGLCPPSHPWRATYLENLSNALRSRYDREGSMLDLLNAVALYREVLDRRPPGHPERARPLYNVSDALLARYKREGNLSDLSEATEHHREGLRLCPPGHPERTHFLYGLSAALFHTIFRTNDTSNTQFEQTLVQEVVEVLREAVNLPDCPPLHRLRAALLWIDVARQVAPNSMLDAYSAALDQLDIVLATKDTLSDKHIQLVSSKELVRCRRLGVEAASYAVRQGHMTLAIELLERGRNLLFAQIARYRVGHEDLRKENPKLAEKFSNLSRLLDASVTVDDIRAVKGFQHFLKSSYYAELQPAAAEGPIIVIIPGEGQSDAPILLEELAEPHHVKLPEAGVEELAELANSLVEAISPKQDYDYDEDEMEIPVKKILRSLWNLVVRPIADALENDLGVPLHSRIWWCPTSVLTPLPLHAAGHYDSEFPNQNIPGRYVSSYTPTIHALLRARHQPNASNANKMLIVAQSGAQDLPGWLPNVQPEAALVKKLIEQKMETTLYSDQDGTHTAVLDGMVNHSWLHLTCHGMQNPVNPLYSCFGLYDKPLTLQDIIQRGLPDARFAFLAACHTATGDHKLLDEGLHLAAGLQFAGFKSVVGTFWEVADIDGPVIAEAFYKALRESPPEGEGMDCNRAAYGLSDAVQELRNQGVPVHRWMRFIHIGI